MTKRLHHETEQTPVPLDIEYAIGVFCDNSLKPGMACGTLDKRPFTVPPPVGAKLWFQDGTVSCDSHVLSDVFKMQDGSWVVQTVYEGILCAPPSPYLQKCATSMDVIQELAACSLPKPNTTGTLLRYLYESENKVALTAWQTPYLEDGFIQSIATKPHLLRLLVETSKEKFFCCNKSGEKTLKSAVCPCSEPTCLSVWENLPIQSAARHCACHAITEKGQVCIECNAWTCEEHSFNTQGMTKFTRYQEDSNKKLCERCLMLEAYKRLQSRKKEIRELEQEEAELFAWMMSNSIGKQVLNEKRSEFVILGAQ